MARAAIPFRFILTQDEIEQIRNAEGSGGQQTLHRRIVSELDSNDGSVTFDDKELGTLIRYMAQYGQGGFQGRLRAAFIRSLRELLAP